MFTPMGLETNSDAPFLSRALYSSCMAAFQFEFERASLCDLGIGEMVGVMVQRFSLLMSLDKPSLTIFGHCMSV